jgi:hypothetical protein
MNKQMKEVPYYVGVGAEEFENLDLGISAAEEVEEKLTAQDPNLFLGICFYSLNSFI